MNSLSTWWRPWHAVVAVCVTEPLLPSALRDGQQTREEEKNESGAPQWRTRWRRQWRHEDLCFLWETTKVLQEIKINSLFNPELTGREASQSSPGLRPRPLRHQSITDTQLSLGCAKFNGPTIKEMDVIYTPLSIFFVPLGNKHKVFVSKFGGGEATFALGKTKHKQMNITCCLPPAAPDPGGPAVG